MLLVGGEGIVEVVLVSKLQHGGVVCHHGCAMSKGVASTIDSLTYLDVHIIPAYFRSFGGYFCEIICLVAVLDFGFDISILY